MTSRNRVAYMPSETWLSYQKRRHPFVHDTSRRFFNASRNPYRDAGDKDDNHYEGSDTHDNLAG